MDFLNNELSKKTIIFGLRVWVVIGIGVGAFIVLILFFLSLWLSSRKESSEKRNHGAVISKVSSNTRPGRGRKSFPQHVVNGNCQLPEGDPMRDMTEAEKDYFAKVYQKDHKLERAQKEIGIRNGTQPPRPDEARLEMANRSPLPPAEKGTVEGDQKVPHWSHDRGSSASSADSPSSIPSMTGIPEVSHLGWGHWYTLRELEAATDSFSDANVLGEGGYGIVYWVSYLMGLVWQ